MVADQRDIADRTRPGHQADDEAAGDQLPELVGEKHAAADHTDKHRDDRQHARPSITIRQPAADRCADRHAQAGGGRHHLDLQGVVGVAERIGDTRQHDLDRSRRDAAQRATKRDGQLACGPECRTGLNRLLGQPAHSPKQLSEAEFAQPLVTAPKQALAGTPAPVDRHRPKHGTQSTTRPPGIIDLLDSRRPYPPYRFLNKLVRESDRWRLEQTVHSSGAQSSLPT